jgi:DNA-damage-inducible protein D
MPYLGYVEWRNFEQAIERAKVAITVQEITVTSHVVGVSVMVNLPQGGSRMMGDYQLSRYGAYHVALSGDPRKPEVAAAIRYFVVKTREAETTPASTPAIPQTYAEALRAAADLSERAEAAEARVACICVELFHAVGRCSGCIDFGIVHYGNLLDANCDGGLCIPGPEVSELM